MHAGVIADTHLHTDTDILHELVDYRDAEFGMIALEIVYQGSQEGDIAELDLPNLGERFEDVVIYLGIVSYAFDLSEVG